MNKIISGILVCVLLLMCLAGCTTTQERSPVKLQSDDVLVCSLVEYLQDPTSYLVSAVALCNEESSFTLEQQIDRIKGGTQALQVEFDGSDNYFACAYYDDMHEDESRDYCCAADYTWVRFENADEICEKYEELDFVVAIQIDKAAVVTDIVDTAAAVPNVERFLLYKPYFNDGLNVKEATEVADCVICLNSSDDKVVYYRVLGPNNHPFIPMLSRDGKYYYSHALYTGQADGSRSEIDLTHSFGKYCDTLMSIMDTDSYVKSFDRGYFIGYGLIEVNELAACIKQIVEE